MGYTYTTEISYSPDYSWDSWAQSVDPLSYDGHYSFQVGLTAAVVCGISPDGIPESYQNIEFGFYFNDGLWQVIESGVPVVGPTGSFSSTSIYKIQRKSNVINYYVDDTLVHASPTQSPDTPVYLYAAMYGYMDSVLNPELVDESYASIDCFLPGIASFGSESDVVISSSVLPAISSEAAELPTATASASLPGFVGSAMADDAAWSLNDLPSFDAFGQQGAISISVITAGGVFPGLTSYAVASDPLKIESEIPAFQSFGVTGSEAEAVDFAGSFSGLPPIEAVSNIGMDAFLVVEIPDFEIQLFSYGNMVRTENAFALAGSMQGTAEYRYINGELLTFDGTMSGAASLSGGLSLVEGSVAGSTEVNGRLEASLDLLSGSAFSGASVSGSFFDILGNVQGTSEFSGKIHRPTFFLDGSLSGETERVAELSGTPVSIIGKIVGTQDVYGRISGALLGLSGTMTSSFDVIGEISGRPVFDLSGELNGMGSSGSIDASLIAIGGQLFATSGAGRQDADMSYFWRR